MISYLKQRPLWMSRLLKPKTLAVIVGLMVLAAVGVYWFVANVLQTVSQEKERLESARTVKVETVSLQAATPEGMAYYGSFQDVRAMKEFAGAYYTATSGGLVAFNGRGQMTARYTALDGLPENDLTALETFQGRLYIGTAGHGLVSFDGHTFTRHRFVQPRADHVTALSVGDDVLLIGTFDSGLLQFDGNQFRRVSSPDEKAEPKQITVVLP
jgi:hypothetical protein